MENLTTALKGAHHAEKEYKEEIIKLQDSITRLQARLASDSRYACIYNCMRVSTCRHKP